MINGIDATSHRVKVSKEKTMHGRLLYSPAHLNKAFVAAFKEITGNLKPLDTGSRMTFRLFARH